MSDTSATTVACTSLAITEKKPQRSGGCVGIFFQLFDWNRRLAKKKLFSKKLLPPARAKRASKKFGADDKLPTAKHLLIADENRGGFPNAKKSGFDVDSSANAERAKEMRSPSLVARLMGLESMPNVRREKPKKALFSESNRVNGKNFLSDSSARCSEHFVYDQADFQLGRGDRKLEPRPQKHQKTELYERRSVTRFGAEALQFRSPLSRSRKHHSKLVSPVKSPRVGRNAARLMGAATKILEPGIRATNRAKCSLSYSPSFHISSRDEVMTQGPSFLTMDDTEQTNYYASSSKAMKGQSSCKSCGNWQDVVDSRSNAEGQVAGVTSSGLGLGSAPPLRPGRSKVKPSESSLSPERDEVASKYQEQPSLVTEAKGNRHSRSVTSNEAKLVFREQQDQCHPSSYRIRYEKEAAPATARSARSKRQSQALPANDRGNVRPKSSIMNSGRDPFTVNSVDGVKDFVAVNQNSASRTKVSMPSKALNSFNFDRERDALDKSDDSLSRMRGSYRRKRPINGTTQVDTANFNQSTFRKQRDVPNNVIVGRLAGSNACSKNRNRVRSEHPLKAKGDAADSQKDVDVISFTFSSPMKHNSESLFPKKKVDKTGSRGEFMSNNTCTKKKLTLDANMGKPASRLASHLSGDALGALLEEKLKELANREREESGDDLPGKSTAAILEELISALTTESPVPVENGDNCSTGFSQDDSVSYASQDPCSDTTSQCQMFIANQEVQALKPAVFAGFPLGGDGERHSPGSVLDASFSNDSCFSESPDGYAARKLHSESMEPSDNQPQPSEYDAELSDCATSISTARTRMDKMTDSLDSIQFVLDGTDRNNIGIVRNDLYYASEVIINADILLGSLSESHRVGDFPVAPLLDKLGALPDAPWSTPNCGMEIVGSKDGYQRRKFLLDCLLEFLDSKYGVYCKSRFKAWPTLPFQVNGESLTKEVYEEIQRCEEFVGKSSDDILMRDMNHSLGSWMDFEVEAFEIGQKIESDILQVLVNEVVIDLEQCRTSRNPRETVLSC
ncbi:hypothetical protein IFM89_020710 [Coptis chinensis]|uniref:DUF4378 domain-containing protein n=1 Tax=Coptis chinensis TaxID=261450 RepID=A0A835LFW9_9MAGN|nr:hypothetical protein IFM89_020710 [Coptis chinensis]